VATATQRRSSRATKSEHVGMAVYDVAVSRSERGGVLPSQQSTPGTLTQGAPGLRTGQQRRAGWCSRADCFTHEHGGDSQSPDR
jgi:hypothetical protein